MIAWAAPRGDPSSRIHGTLSRTRYAGPKTRRPPRMLNDCKVLPSIVRAGRGAPADRDSPDRQTRSARPGCSPGRAIHARTWRGCRDGVRHAGVDSPAFCYPPHAALVTLPAVLSQPVPMLPPTTTGRSADFSTRTVSWWRASGFLACLFFCMTSVLITDSASVITPRHPDQLPRTPRALLRIAQSQSAMTVPESCDTARTNGQESSRGGAIPAAERIHGGLRCIRI